ncbi:MAG: hypothetical protein KDK70_33860 [Myxococcales bacterium]|nr:hypothetical protein [Myxococcales bacterium]
MISQRTSTIGWLGRAALGLVAAASACKKDPAVVRLPDEPAPQRAAQSFVHCVEARTSQCVETAEQLGGWDAFYLLAWLGGGSPVTILEALPGELDDHVDPRRVQRRFVDEVERYASSIRGAGCQGVSTDPIDPLIDQAASVAAERLGRLGLWTGNTKEVVEILAEEAHEGLGGGALVRFDCGSDPFRLYVATHERDGRHVVVGLTTMMPSFIDEEPPGREVVAERLGSRALGLSISAAPLTEGVVDPWLSFPVEEF